MQQEDKQRLSQLKNIIRSWSKNIVQIDVYYYFEGDQISDIDLHLYMTIEKKTCIRSDKYEFIQDTGEIYLICHKS